MVSKLKQWFMRRPDELRCHAIKCMRCGYVGFPRTYFEEDKESGRIYNQHYGCPICGDPYDPKGHKYSFKLCLKPERHITPRKDRVLLSGQNSFHMSEDGTTWKAKSIIQLNNIARMKAEQENARYEKDRSRGMGQQKR